MQEQEKKSGDTPPEKELREDLKKGGFTVRGMVERIRALQHPNWRQDDDADSLRSALDNCSSKLERLSFRYEAQSAELKKIKLQYADLEHKFLMRPDTMRRVGEMEVTELVKKQHELAELERALQNARTETENERSAQALNAKECLEARLAEIEAEYSGRKKGLDAAGQELGRRENDLAEAEARLREQLVETRQRAIEETTAMFDREMAAKETLFLREKAILQGEAESWRRKAGEVLSQLSEVRAKTEELENELLAARESAQKIGAAKLNMDACMKRSAELDKKNDDIEKRLLKLSEREEACRRAEEAAQKAARELKDNSQALEKDYAEKKQAFENVKARMRAEIDDLVRRHGGQ